MKAMASQISSLMIVYWTVYSRHRSKKHQSLASLAFVRGINQWPVNSPHKGPVTRKMFPFDDVIMNSGIPKPSSLPLMTFFDLHLNKRLSKQSWGWWFEMLSRPLWRQCNDMSVNCVIIESGNALLSVYNKPLHGPMRTYLSTSFIGIYFSKIRKRKVLQWFWSKCIWTYCLQMEALFVLALMC